MSRWTALLAVALVITFVVRVGAALERWSATVDEPEYVTAGYSYVATGEIRIATWHPPLAFALAGAAVRARFSLPFPPAGSEDAWAAADGYQLARAFLYDERRATPDAAAILHTARLPSLLLGLATILVIGAWARALWGDRAGLVALALAAFEPTLIAHSALATPDIGLTCFTVATAALAWWFACAPSRRRWAAVLVCGALALETKHVALLLAPAIALALAEQISGAPEPRVRLRAIARPILESLALLAGALVIAALATRGAILEVAGSVLTGLRGQLWHVEHLPTAFLHGAISPTGWWYYFPVALLVKLPLGTLALLALALALPRRGVALVRANGGFLIAPAAVFLVFMMWTHIDLGVRLVLPCYPFLIVLAARAATLPGRARWFAGVAIAATIGSSAVAAGHELSYFNGLARDPSAWLTDSNLDWGQDLDVLAAELRAADAPPVYLAYFGGGSPSYLGIRHETIPASGGSTANADGTGDHTEPGAPCAAARQWIAISTTRMQGVTEPDRDRFAWLAARPPLRTIGDTIRIYDVTGDAASHVRLAELFGAASPAGRCERRRALALDPASAARLPSEPASPR